MGRTRFCRCLAEKLEGWVDPTGSIPLICGLDRSRKNEGTGSTQFIVVAFAVVVRLSVARARLERRDGGGRGEVRAWRCAQQGPPAGSREQGHMHSRTGPGDGGGGGGNGKVQARPCLQVRAWCPWGGADGAAMFRSCRCGQESILQWIGFGKIRSLHQV